MTELIHTRAELGTARTAASGRVAVVMTMGALHEGHRRVVGVQHALEEAPRGVTDETDRDEPQQALPHSSHGSVWSDSLIGARAVPDDDASGCTRARARLRPAAAGSRRATRAGSQGRSCSS